MKIRFHLSKPAVGLIAAVLCAGNSSAATVYLNSSVASPGTGTSVAGFKLRASPTSWDMALMNQGGTPAAMDSITSNLASNFNSGGGQTLRFTIEHRPGQGFVFTTVRGTTTSTLAWGTFAPAVMTSTQVASINGVSPGASFNTLSLEALAVQNNSSVRVRDLLFTSPSLSVVGAFANSTISSSGTFYNGQSLVSDTDLSTVAWTLTGEVRLQRPGGSGDEQVRFTVTAKQGGTLAVPAVPEPGATALGLLALAGLAQRRRR